MTLRSAERSVVMLSISSPCSVAKLTSIVFAASGSIFELLETWKNPQLIDMFGIQKLTIDLSATQRPTIFFDCKD